MMDVVFLSRLQFGIAACFHFLFVPLTLGLSILLAIMETRYAKTGDEDYRRMARFWGKLFVINFVVGVVTGLTLEFQFGTNWSRYSAYVGDIFGSLLAIEASVAFFLESTFMGVWIFGWKRISPKAHATVMWLVAAASSFSAVWIIIANAWMQHPVGYVIRNGRAELNDFLAVVTQPFAWHTLLHTLSGAYVLAAFFVMGVSAYHLLRRYEIALFTKSFRLALTFGLIFAIVAAVHGHYNGGEVAKTQPTKLAAMESHWETEKGAPIYLLAIPDEKNNRNALQILPIPGALSMLAYHSPSAEVKGLNHWPKEERPPVALTFISFRLMVGLGMLFMGLTILGWFIRHRLMEYGWFLKVMLYAIPLPYIALQAGWVVAEVGRQPWIVYGVMKTAEAASPLAVSQVAVSLVGFIAIYTLLSIVAFWLLLKAARKGPETALAITL
ncbi:MAG: cytochrome ubiquinol oxidase subunit I [Deltaproteobacteria bacterium]|nr:cytochrome ubiquinol oxidase subunit I [Deltaproteobacteria bacterium]